MGFLLDTSAVSNLRRKRPHPLLLSFLASVARDEVFMCAPTVAEIQCGICLIEEPIKAAEVQAWFDGMLRDGFPSIVPFDAEAARIMARMWTTPALDKFVRNDPRGKKPKSGGDLAIAACAIARHMAVVTDDVDDFMDIHAEFRLPGLYGVREGKFHVEPAP